MLFRSLPTEAEWEFAARAGGASTFPWGDELEPGGRHMINVFQGEFPTDNTKADGWAGTCPVTSFEPNAFGLHNMVGNVWEWTSDPFSAARNGELVLKAARICATRRTADVTGRPPGWHRHPTAAPATSVSASPGERSGLREG